MGQARSLRVRGEPKHERPATSHTNVRLVFIVLDSILSRRSCSCSREAVALGRPRSAQDGPPSQSSSGASDAFPRAPIRCRATFARVLRDDHVSV